MKAKKQFKEWYRGYIKGEENRYLLIDGTYLDFFNQLPISMQWGVYQDWADSLGYLVLAYQGGKGWGYEFILRDATDKSIIDVGEDYESLNEARQAAIEALIKLIDDE